MRVLITTLVRCSSFPVSFVPCFSLFAVTKRNIFSVAASVLIMAPTLSRSLAVAHSLLARSPDPQNANRLQSRQGAGTPSLNTDPAFSTAPKKDISPRTAAVIIACVIIAVLLIFASVALYIRHRKQRLAKAQEASNKAHAMEAEYMQTVQVEIHPPPQTPTIVLSRPDSHTSVGNPQPSKN